MYFPFSVVNKYRVNFAVFKKDATEKSANYVTNHYSRCKRKRVVKGCDKHRRRQNNFFALPRSEFISATEGIINFSHNAFTS